MKLSILICSIHSRASYLTNLLAILEPQLTHDVEVLVELDSGESTIGEKRNTLVQAAQGEYISFIDDDDEVSSNYVYKILQAIKSRPDCCSLTGVITWDGNNPEVFEHSIKYPTWKTNSNNEPIKYERNPNHLNAIKRSIAIRYDFIPINHGEDRDWSMRIQDELKTESTIDGVIYHYKFVSNK